MRRSLFNDHTPCCRKEHALLLDRYDLKMSRTVSACLTLWWPSSDQNGFLQRAPALALSLIMHAVSLIGPYKG